MWPEFGDQDMWLMSIPWNHLLDIGVMWFLAYQVYTRFRRTQAMRLLVRVFIVWLAYLAAQAGGLTLTSFLLWALWIAVLIFFLITFQQLSLKKGRKLSATEREDSDPIRIIRIDNVVHHKPLGP